MERGAISDRSFWATAAVLVAAFLLVRFVVAFSYWPRHLDTGEFYYGMTGREFLNGPILGILEYQVDPIEGGSIIVGAFTSIAFFFVGPSYAALKLIAFICDLGSLLLWALLASKIFGRRVSLWYIAVAILLPPSLLYWSLWLNGKWTFPGIVHAISLLLLLRLINAKANAGLLLDRQKSSIFTLVVFGAVLGFGIYLSSYFFIIAIYALGIFAFYRIPDSLSKVCALATGFLIGLIPWIAYNFHYGFESLKIFGWGAVGDKVYFTASRSFSGWMISNSVRVVSGMSNMILYWWVDSWFSRFISGFLRTALGRLYEFLVLLGVVFFLFSIRKAPNPKIAKRSSYILPYSSSVRRNGGIVFCFFALCILVTCLSNINVVREDYYPYRYLLPLMPFYLLSIAICFDRLSLCSIRVIRFASWSVAFVFFILLFIADLPLLSRWDMKALLRTPGYDYSFLGNRLAAGGSKNDALARAERIRDRQDKDDVIGYIADMSWFGLVADRSESVPKPGCGQLTAVEMERFKSMAEGGVEERHRPFLYRGLGRGFSWAYGSRFEKIGEMTDMLDPEVARWAWQGVGSIEARRRGRSIDWLLPSLGYVPDSARGPFCEGVGAELGFQARMHGDDFASRIRGLPEDVRARCAAGMEIGVIRRPFVSLEW